MHDADSAAIEYWYDSSCYRQQRHITIPYMHIIAKDDYLCYNNAMQTYILNYTLNNNPNIILVTTQCGGHLGWQQSESSESSKIEIDSKSGSESRSSSSRSSSWFGNSWADNATSDFFQAIIDTNTNHNTDTNIKEKEEENEEETNKQTRADANAIRLEQNRRIENEEAIDYSRRYRSRL
ncbi:hypothetical protein FRACYDRAFT_271008 [Fragilariopsis cylindrus CCMP1102]|uniref:Uncharacterized protein n=1 Tax=Fragilariopsis cylindrus CCMP1102 TaxID=635003 RepID=A0A1E7EYG0_9STRA|nr:hypothetical protein FRACYDRAFT_271008 [Fragilariopsis cylindrus CCMP1102]|eukprot:OEU10874.1 hypothetical protein FRACYDRAFT_271008 [Fragilariopsis cylindrus CCMP1102]